MRKDVTSPTLSELPVAGHACHAERSRLVNTCPTLTPSGDLRFDKSPMAHKRMISRADLEATLSRSGPMAANPPPRPPNHEFYEQQMRERQQAELARRRSQRPTDRNLPEGIDKLVVGEPSENYKDLRELERQLDAVMMRKRLDIQDTYQTSQQRQGTLRLWISNTVENQPWQQNGIMDQDAFDFQSNVEATFKVKIEGRLLEDEPDTSSTEANSKTGENADVANEDGEPPAKRPRLSSSKKLSGYFKLITIDFDRSSALQPDNYNRIVWDKGNLSSSTDPRATDFECLEFTRKGDENINITINLTRDEANPKMKLATPLSELLGVEFADRKTVLLGLWEYIKFNKLLSEGSDGRHVQCDQRLKEVCASLNDFPLFTNRVQALGCGDHLYFPDLAQKIMAVMFDAPPISLSYTIRVDKEFQSGDKPPPATIYDIPVPVNTSSKDSISVLFQHDRSQGQTLQKIADTDDHLAFVIQRMNQAKAKHGFFTSMSKDPATFIKRWVSSQKRDLDVIMGAGAWGEEDWQGAEWRQGGTGGPWGSEEAWEGVGSFLMKQDAGKQRAAAT